MALPVLGLWKLFSLSGTSLQSPGAPSQPCLPRLAPGMGLLPGRVQLRLRCLLCLLRSLAHCFPSHLGTRRARLMGSPWPAGGGQPHHRCPAPFELSPLSPDPANQNQATPCAHQAKL